MWSYSVLREAIISGVLAPGERLVEGKIASQLGVSRAPLREALVRLETTGLLSRNEHGYAFVRELSGRELYEISFVRELLEVAAVKLACAAHSTFHSEALDRLRALLDDEEQLLEQPDRSMQLKLNQQFHSTLWSLADNEHLEATLLGSVDRIQVALAASPHGDLNLHRSHFEHKELLARIKARDEDGAAEVMTRHLEGTRQNISDALAATEELDPLHALAASMKRARS